MVSIPFQLLYHPRVALEARLIVGLGNTLACAPSGCMYTDHCKRGSHPDQLNIVNNISYNNEINKHNNESGFVVHRVG